MVVGRLRPGHRCRTGTGSSSLPAQARTSPVRRSSTSCTTAGYTASSAAGVMATTHPLFIRTGRNRYRVLTSLERPP